MAFWNKKTAAGKEPNYAAMRNVTGNRADWSLSTSEAIYAAVARIANTVAMLPLHLYHNQEIAVDDWREKLVSYMPNGTMTPYVFKQTMEAFRNTEGTAFAFIVPDASTGKVQRLDVLDAAQVQIQRATETKEIWYSFQLDGGQTAMVHSSQMLVLPHMSANGQKGIRPIDVLKGTLTYNDKIKEFSVKQLEGMNHGIVLTLPGTATDPKRSNDLVSRFIETYTKSGGKVMVLEGGVQATTISQNPVNAQVLDVERITKNRVATVYSIPPHMLGDYTDATYSTAEQSQQEFLDMTINPIVTLWQEELNLKLLTYEEIRSGYQFRFDITMMKRADTATTAEKYQKAVRGGWMRPNEVRLREGLPPVDEGDTLLASRDLAPLDEVVKGLTGNGI